MIVLVIVMAVMILSLGYIARSDTELACGRNMLLRTRMDCLAESALAHGRGLILNPQDVDTEASGYWTSASGQQLGAGDDYYDVSVTQLGPCDYEITGTAYRLQGAQRVGRGGLTADLRLDPCVALWAAGTMTIPATATVIGDVYCGADLTNNGNVDGDAFAAGSVSGTFTGSANQAVTEPPVTCPTISALQFSSQYYIEYSAYPVYSIDANLTDVTFAPDAANPAGVLYCPNDVTLAGNVTINGTLAVGGDLTITGGGNSITAEKNFPAVLVAGNMTVRDGAALTITGLAKIGQQVIVDPNAGTYSLTVNGGLFIETGSLDDRSGNGSIVIEAMPHKAALQIWPAAGDVSRWRQAADAFFKSIVSNL